VDKTKDQLKAEAAIRAQHETRLKEDAAWDTCVSNALERSKEAASAKEDADTAAQLQRDIDRAARPPRAASWDAHDDDAWAKVGRK